MPARPSVVVPLADQSGLDYRAAVQLKHNGIEPDPAPTENAIRLTATNVDAGGWGNPSALTSPPGVPQNALAFSLAPGNLATVDWNGVSVGGREPFRVLTVQFSLYFMGRWSATLDRPGDATVHAMLVYQGREVYAGHFRLSPTADPLAEPAPATPIPASESAFLSTEYRRGSTIAKEETSAVFRDIFGHNFTVQDILDAGDDLKLQLRARQGRETFDVTWHTATARMRLEYQEAAPPVQTAVRWQIFDRAQTTILFDSEKTLSSSQYFTVTPPAVLDADAGDVSIRVRVWDELDAFSTFSVFRDASFLSAGAAALIHDPGAIVYLLHWYPAVWLDAAGWFKSTTQGTVWRKKFARADQPLVSFNIDGWEIEGADAGMVEVDSVVESGSTPGSWFWDQDGTSAEALDNEPTIFVHMPSSFNSRPPGGFNASGIAMRLEVYLATQYLHAYGRNYIGLVLTLPTFRRSLDDVISGRTAAPQGSLVLHNPHADESLPEGPRLWQTGIAHGQPPIDGWLVDDRRLLVFAGGVRSGQFIAEGDPPVWDGVTRWQGLDLGRDQVSVPLLPRALRTDVVEIGIEAYDIEVYGPGLNAINKHEGEPIPECWGTDSGGTLPAAIVNPGQTPGPTGSPFPGAGPRVIMRASVVSDLDADTIFGANLVGRGVLYLGRDIVDTSFYSWDASTSHLLWNLPVGSGVDPARAFFEANQDGEWRIMVFGDGRVAGVLSAGLVAEKLLLDRLGIPAADLASGSFSGVEQLDERVKVAVVGPTKLHEVLFRLMRTGDFGLVHRYDGRIGAALLNPTELSSAVPIEDYQILGDGPAWRIDDSSIAKTMTVFFPAEVPEAALDEARAWQALDERVGPQFGIDRELSPDVHSYAFDDRPLLRHARFLRTPIKRTTIRWWRRGLFLTAGEVVPLLLKNALAPGGVMTWAGCLVESSTPGHGEQGDFVDLELRYVFDLKPEAIPGVLQ